MVDERELTPLQVEEINKETRGFQCPSCRKHLQFRVAVKVTAVMPTLTGEEVAARDAGMSLPIEKASITRLLGYYRDVGILDAFTQVVKEHFADKMPNDPDKFFLTFLKTSVRATMIPKLALQRLINEFDGGNIEVYTAQQIAAVVSDGTLRCFVPAHLLRGEVVRMGKGSNTKLRTRATEERLETWIRTRHGYVVGRGLMFQEMQKQARGDFDNVRTA